MSRLDRNTYLNKFHINIKKQEILIKKTKGKSLMEMLVLLFIISIVTIIIANFYLNSMRHYLGARRIDNSEISVMEALEYIDYYVNFYGEFYYIEDSKLFIEAKDGKRKNYICLDGTSVRVAYKNETGKGYTSQPLLYDVEEFNLSENGKVIFVEILTNEGVNIKKAIGRI